MTTALPQSLGRVALGTALLLLIPLVAMRFTNEVNWTGADFLVAGGLLFGAGLAFTLLTRLDSSAPYRLAVGVAVAAGLLLVWANLAVGLVGNEHNPVNLLFGSVLLVALGGAIGARFRPRGMAWAMFAAALTYVAAAALALFVWPPTPEPAANLPNVVVANGILAALWAVSGWLFQRAAAAGSRLGQ